MIELTVLLFAVAVLSLVVSALSLAVSIADSLVPQKLKTAAWSYLKEEYEDERSIRAIGRSLSKTRRQRKCCFHECPWQSLPELRMCGIHHRYGRSNGGERTEHETA